jgi:hypothetical protein
LAAKSQKDAIRSFFLDHALHELWSHWKKIDLVR